MGQPIAHFEIIGEEPAKLRRFYSELFGWDSEKRDAVTQKVSAPGNHWFVDANGSGSGINGGIWGRRGL